MPLAAVIGSALNGIGVGVAHPFAIFIDGLDVVAEPATPKRYGVDPASIQVTEAAPGSVSSMTFTIDDPYGLITIGDTALITAWDFVRDVPVFTGYPQVVDASVDFGNQGRSIAVTCYGAEALLDQFIVAQYVLLTGGPISQIDQTTVLQGWAASVPLLREFGGTSVGSRVSSQPLPTGDEWSEVWINTYPTFTASGMSIRRAWEALIPAAQAPPGWPTPQLTVDFYWGLRLWWYGGSPAVGVGSTPTDYATITVTESGALRGAGLRYVRDTSPGTIITEVYVAGGNAAGTGWVAGDTTRGRGQAYISDNTITTWAQAQAAAGAILGQKGTGAGRGELTLEAFTPVGAHPGSTLLITNAALGWTARPFTISEIRKTFYPGGQDWALSFFDQVGQPAAGMPSAMRAIRQTTRTLI